MTKNNKFILCSLIVFCALFSMVIFRHYFRAWNDLSILMISSQYFEWKQGGGPYKVEFYSAINMDKFRSEFIVDRPIDEMKEKFIGSKLASSFPEGSYRKSALYDFKKHQKIDDLLFFDQNEDGFGYAISIIAGRCKEIILVKG